MPGMIGKGEAMKKFLVLALFLLVGCGTTTVLVPTTGVVRYSAPAKVSTESGIVTACRGDVTIEQVKFGTYNVYWIGADHKTRVILGVHDIVVTDPPPGDTTCN
jgi:hypothetical protein